MKSKEDMKANIIETKTYKNKKYKTGRIQKSKRLMQQADNKKQYNN